MRGIQPIIPGSYYHIYNRGVQDQPIFRRQQDYHCFLDQFESALRPVSETIAYCLLKTHFHALLFVRQPQTDHADASRTESNFTRQLSRFFRGYAQRFNKEYGRSGRLFVCPFRRKLIESELYLSSLIFYIHANAQHHGLVSAFPDWPHSSYPMIVNESEGLVDPQRLFDWFGGKSNFLRFHQQNKVCSEDRSWNIELRLTG